MTGKDIFDNYKDLQTERSVLEIQIKNFMGVTDADIIASMCFGHPDDSADRVQTSGTSDKTASVAMKYHEVAIRENQEWYEWLLNKYLELDAELCFFDGCVDALGSKRAPIIRDLLDGESTWDDIAYTHHVGRATISRYRKEAVEEIDRRIRQRNQEKVNYMLYA